MPDVPSTSPQMIEVSEAVAFLDHRDFGSRPITVIGTEKIRNNFDATCLEQAVNCKLAPGVTDIVLNPDAHAGFGAPVGCVLVSPTHIYPGPVGVDIKCSMSLLQLSVAGKELEGREVRRALIDAIGARIPTGAGKGQRSAKKARHIPTTTVRRAIIEGASKEVCEAIGIPPHWAQRCEDAAHRAHDGSIEGLERRLEMLERSGVLTNLNDKLTQLGSYGGGNHFGEANVVTVDQSKRARAAAEVFGLRDGHIAFLSHCGSRGLGHALATNQFKTMQARFSKMKIPLPGGDREMVHAPLGSPMANDYLDDMALGANFATLNHLLINALVLEAFQEVLPGSEGELVYFISHNIARLEKVRGHDAWVHRKGVTRAFPAKHDELLGTPFYQTGHPILLPGNPAAGSAVMVAEKGAELACYSVNHGAGRALGRRRAIAELNQRAVDDELQALDILSNCRQYPKDEAPAAYKDFNEVLRSVELAGLASEVARLRARFVIKDGDTSLRGAA